MVADQLLQFRSGFISRASGEFGVRLLFDGRQAPFLEVVSYASGERLIAKVGHGRSPP